MVRRPPRSTLFPTRRSSDLESRALVDGGRAKVVSQTGEVEIAVEVTDAIRPGVVSIPHRSEEHTSELQSQFHLVCRLLLEKKKAPQSVRPPQRRRPHRARAA